MTSKPPDFDPIAGAYRWMEYLSLGPMLERARWFHLDQGALDCSRQALILGDGDGRFTRRLLARNPGVNVTAVDSSAAMLDLLLRRCKEVESRLTTHRGDALQFSPVLEPDLIVTHFFLDCLSQEEVSALVSRLGSGATPGCLWLVSEFRVPGGILHRPVELLIRGLYFVFRILTGLRITRLPDHSSALRDSGFSLREERCFLAGVLTTQLWSLGESGVQEADPPST